MQSILTKIISPLGGHGASHLAGGMIGAGFGYFISSWRASNEKNKLILQLQHLPQKTAESLNDNYKLILANTCKQLNALDKNCKLELKLGDVISPQFDEFCNIKPHSGNEEAWHIEKLHSNVGTQSGETSSGLDIEKIIDEYFESYFGNREEVKSENRAAAIVTVTLFHNTSILLIQLMKSVAHLPGKENEQRLEQFKAIIKDFWKNVTNNKVLMENLNKNIFQKFQEIFTTSNTQRMNLATHIEIHYSHLINQLKIEQNDLSVQQMSLFSFRHLQELGRYFMEIVARIFDKEAAQEMTEITAYKMAKGMLRAETSDQCKVLGFKAFYDDGICSLLKPLAMITEGLKGMSHQEDGLSFVRYQDLMNEMDLNKLLWKTGNQFNSINSEEQRLIATDIRDICKLMFICQSLEKEFIQSASQYGFQGMIDRGEFQAKRFIIQLFYDEAMKRMRDFFTKHKDIQLVLKSMSDPEWSKKWNILTQAWNHQYIQSSKLDNDDKILIHQDTSLTNIVLSERITQLQFQRTQIDYVFQAFLELKNEKSNQLVSTQTEKNMSYDTKAMKVYLFNVCNLLEEYNLFHHIKPQDNPIISKNQNESLPINDLSTALDMTQKQIEKIKHVISELSGQCMITSSYSGEELRLSLNSKMIAYEIKFGEKTAKISPDLYEALKKFKSKSKWVSCNLLESDTLFKSVSQSITNSIPMPQMIKDVSNTVSSSVSNVVTQLVTEQRVFDLKFPKDFDLYQFMKYFESMREDFRVLQEIAGKSEQNAPLQSWLEEFEKILTLMQGVVNHVSLQEEYNKRLAANNKLLKSENTQQKEYINTLSQNVEKLTNAVEQSQITINELEKSGKKNVELVEEGQKHNAVMYTYLLKEFEDSVHDVEEMRESLTKQINNIKKNVKEDSMTSKDLMKLEQDVEVRAEKILKRFENYTAVFKKANQQTQETFDKLKLKFSLEQKMISQLKNQLMVVLQELENQRKELEHFKQRKGNLMIVNSFDSLFEELEERFAPRLSFWSSYRPVKTKNLLTFIQMLLNSQSFLTDDRNQYKNKENFNEMIRAKLDNSRIINAHRGISNTSQSKAIFKTIIEAFVDGTLVRKLKEGNQIAYHGAYIKLSEQEKLSYQEISMDCSVQPVMSN